jgi:hypothetical protein
LNEGSRKGS